MVLVYLAAHRFSLYVDERRKRRGIRPAKTIEGWKVLEGQEHRVVNVGELHLNLARLFYEWNRLDEAQTHLQTARLLNELSQFPPVLALELETTFHLHCARGETGAAYAQLRKLDQMVNEVHPNNRFYQQMFGVMAMNLRLSLAATVPALKHLLDEVSGWVKARGLKPDDAFGYPHEGSYWVLARSLLAQGKEAQALPLLERLARAAQSDRRADDFLGCSVLLALAHQSLAQETKALEVLRAVLELAESQGYCRSFVDLGPAMQRLLERANSLGNHPYLQTLLQAFPASEPTPPAPAPMPLTPPAPQPSTEPDWPMPLNERELSVLRLLATGNSNKEIAKALELSPNTVRWYVSNLLSKLGVGSRLEAVSRARELKLL